MPSGAGASVRRALVLLSVGGLATGLLLLPAAMVASSEAQPSELPRAFLDTALVPPSGRTIAVPAGGNFQAALNAAQPGDVITLQAGATFHGPFTLPNKAGVGWITVRTSAPDSSLPPPGTRVSPSYAAVMPKLVVGTGVGGAIQTAAQAHHFRFIGIEVKPLAGAPVYTLIEFGNGRETSDEMLPHNMIVDRCYVHGNAGEAAVRGVAFNGKSLAVIDSYLSDFKDQVQDTQAIMGWNGPGPFKIVNNYLEAAGENIMFGGGDPSIANLVPSDIEIRHNHLFKPTAWRGVWAAVKNLFELKNARRVLVEGNVFEHTWLAAQAGFAVQFTVRNQYGTAPWSTIEDVTFQLNIVRHAAAGMNILASDDPHPSQTMKRVLIRHNLFDDITSAWGGQGRLFQILGWAGGATGLVIDHNTGVQTENLNYSDGVPHLGFIYSNNLTPRGAGSGFIGAGTLEGLPTLIVYFPLAVFLRNVLAGGFALIYPPENYFPRSLAAVGFVDLAGRNYRLAPSSPYKNAATDGTDIGADLDALEAATAGVVSTTEPPEDTTPPTVMISSPTAGQTVSGVVTITVAAADNVGVTRMDYLQDGQLLAALTPPAFTFPWSTTSVSNGSHSLTARAYDAAGNIATSAPVAVTVNNPDLTPPTATITSPTSNPTYTTSSSPLTLGGTAADNVGVTQVTWANNRGGSGTATGTTSWTASGIVLQPGINVLTVTARDGAANTASARLTVTLSETFTFTDDPLTPQSTLIRAVHVMELRTAIDSVRVARGLAPFAWTDPTLTIGSTPVRVVHLTELRTALSQAYQAAGRAAPTYTDPTELSVIKAIHLSELRAAVRAL
jgi:hypothetical protein